jgi:hypothetical protein
MSGQIAGEAGTWRRHPKTARVVAVIEHVLATLERPVCEPCVDERRQQARNRYGTQPVIAPDLVRTDGVRRVTPPDAFPIRRVLRRRPGGLVGDAARVARETHEHQEESATRRSLPLPRAFRHVLSAGRHVAERHDLERTS